MLKVLWLFLVALSLNLGLIHAQTTASNCGYGMYKNGAVCTICPAGYYCNGVSKVACPVGTSTNNATGAGQCTECMPDTYAPTTASKFCLACPAGSFCPNKTTAIQCGKGTAGKINRYDYRMNASMCVPCPLGMYASVAGSAYCNVCPNGSYCVDPTVSPVPCPKGTSSTVDNDHTMLYYSPDASGYLWNNSWQSPPTIYYNGFQYLPGQRCFPCPMGYYADTTGSKICKKCPPGKYCADKTTYPYSCPKGYYTANDTTSTQYNYPPNGDSCLRCPIGTYTPTTSATSCTPCPDGKYCPDPASDPLPIPAGFYVQNNSYWDGNTNTNVYVLTMYQCSPGTYMPNNTNDTNATYNNYYSGYGSCVPCPAGYFCPDPAKEPQPCPPGFYSSYGYASTCTPCSTGYYASQNGSIQCTQCPAGAYCADPTIEPILCPPGSYSPYGGLTQCYQCSSGWNYASQPGSTTCNQCPMDCCCKDPTQEPVCSGSTTQNWNGGSSNWYNNWNSTQNWWQTTPPPNWGQSTSGWNNYWQTTPPPNWGQSTSGWNNYWQTTPPPWQTTQNGQTSYPPYGTSTGYMGRR